MKKMMLLVLGVMLCASTAMATVYINWNTINGVVAAGNPDNAAPPPGGFLLDGYSAIWQLIYAGSDNAIDPINDSMPRMDEAAWAANNYLRPGGNDELIAQRIIPQGGGTAADGTSWNNWMVNQSGDVNYFLAADGGQNWWDNTAMVYQRIFQCDGITWIAPDAGMHGSTPYYETPAASMLQVNTLNPGAPSEPQPFPVADAEHFGVPQQGNLVYTIPEPATMGLLGLGALVMAIRRRRS